MKINGLILFKTMQIATFVVFAQSCNPLGSEKAKVEFRDPSVFKNLSTNISAVSVVNNQLVIDGTKLSSIQNVTLTNGSQTESFAVESVNDSQIIANGAQAISIAAGGVFDLILSSAYASATYQVTFGLANNVVTTAKIADGAVTGAKIGVTANAGDFLKYNGTTWVAAGMYDGQTYQGAWDASTNAFPSLVSPGDYYIVSVAGSFGSPLVSYSPGDWIITDGYAWQKVGNSKAVSSFQGRRGVVTLQPSDYVTMIDTTTNKLTGSKISDIADVDFSTPPTVGQVLKWNNTTSKWVPGDDTAGTSGIALSSLSATTPLSYNSTTGVFSTSAVAITALPLTNLSSGTGAIVATDTILGAFGKLMSIPSDYVSKSGNTTMTTGTLALSGAAMITVPTATGTTLTEVANVTYVNNSIAANGQWTKGASSSINYTAGNVGIGTTAPSMNLTLGDTTANTYSMASALAGGVGQYKGWAFTNTTGSTIYSAIQFFNDATNDSSIRFKTWAGTVGGTEALVIRGVGGNIGIGTSAPQGRLDIFNATNATTTPLLSMRSDFSAAGKFGMIRFGDQSQSVNYQKGALIYESVAASSRGKFHIALENTDTSGSVGLSDAKLTVQSDGKVGIGTSSPTARLHIENSSGTGPALVVKGTAGQDILQMYDSSGNQKSSFSQFGDMYNWSRMYNSTIDLYQHITLASNMNFGWSSTTSPLASEDTALSRISAAKVAVGNGTSGDYSGTLVTANIGVGTPSPSTKLHVVGDTTSEGGLIKFTTSALDISGTTGIRGNGNGWTRFDANGGKFLIPVTGSEVTAARTILDIERTDTWAKLFDLRTDGSATFAGKVGIGVSSPSTLLHLVGNRNAIITQTQNTAMPDGSSYDVGGINYIDNYLRDSATSSPAAFMKIRSINTNGGFPVTIRGTQIEFGTANGGNGQGTSADTKLAINPDGLVGVNTSTPTRGRLEVQQSVDNVSSGIAIVNSGVTASARIWVDTAVHLSGGSSENSPILLNGGGSGSVGIGTVSPVNTLEVAGSGARFTGSYSEGTTNSGVYAGYVNSTPRVGFFNGTSSQNWQIDNSFGDFRWYTPGVVHLQLSTSGGMTLPNATSGTIRASGTGNNWFMGNIGIGTITPSSPLTVYTTNISGNIATFTSGGAGGAGCSIAWNGTSCSSDIRLKENVRSLNSSEQLEKIMKLNPVHFSWIKDSSHSTQTGFIAQEFERIFPEFVKTEKDGFKQLNYAHFVSVLTSGLQEFVKNMKSLKSELLGLRTEMRSVFNSVASKESAQDKEIESLRFENDKLKKYLCAKDPSAQICI